VRGWGVEEPSERAHRGGWGGGGWGVIQTAIFKRLAENRTLLYRKLGKSINALTWNARSSIPACSGLGGVAPTSDYLTVV